MSAKRAMWQVVSAQVITASGVSAEGYFPEAFNEAILYFAVSAIGGTTPSFTFKYQYSPDAGTTWFDKASAATSAITANGNAAIELPNCIGQYCRVAWTVSGTTPTATVNIWMSGKKHDG